MTEFNKAVNELCLSESKLAQRFGVVAQTITNWKKIGVPQDRLQDVAQFFQEVGDLAWLISDQAEDLIRPENDTPIRIGGKEVRRLPDGSLQLLD